MTVWLSTWLRPRPATDQVKGTKPTVLRVNRPETSTPILPERCSPAIITAALQVRSEGFEPPTF